MSSIVKFMGEQSRDQHGDKLWWPGWYGMPSRGNIPLGLSQEAYDNSFEVVGDFHKKEFDLSVPEDDTEYTQIMDRIVNGWYILHFIDRTRHPESGVRKIYLEWIQRYSVMTEPADKMMSVVTRAG